MAQQQPQVWAGVPWAAPDGPQMLAPGPSPFVTPPGAPAGELPAKIAPETRQEVAQAAAAKPEAAPELKPIAMPAGPPNVFAGGPATPNVRPQTPIEQQEDVSSQRLKSLQAKDTYDWSQHSKLRNFGHVAATIGNIAGDIFAPKTMELIPGTQLNREVQEGSLSSRLQSLAQEQSENEQRDAATGKTEEDTSEAPQKAEDAHGESSALTREANDKAEALENEPAAVQSLAAGHAYAVQQALSRGEDPASDPIVQHYEQAIRSTVPGFNKQDESATIQREVGGKPHTILVDKANGKDIADEGPTGEKPPTVNVNEGQKEALAQRQQIFKTYQPVMDSAERMNVMTQNYQDAVNNHNQQAMLSLLYNHMGMTMGLQKGARMTQDLIREAQQSQPWLQGLKAKFDNQGYLTGVVLSPQQMRDMVGLAQDRYKEDVGKARNEAGYLGASDDGPKRTPGAATISYYVGLANGNAPEARKLAAADGWSVQ